MKFAKHLIDNDEKISQSHNKEQNISANKKNNNSVLAKKRYLLLLTVVLSLAIYHIYQNISDHLPPHPIPLIREQHWHKKTKANKTLTTKVANKEKNATKNSKNKSKNGTLIITKQPATINQGRLIMTKHNSRDK